MKRYPADSGGACGDNVSVVPAYAGVGDTSVQTGGTNFGLTLGDLPIEFEKSSFSCQTTVQLEVQPMPTRTTIGIALVAALVIGGAVMAGGVLGAQPPAESGTAQMGETPHAGDGAVGPVCDDGVPNATALGERFGLTDDQTAELETLITDLEAEDASHEAIRTAVHDELAEFGVDRPAEVGALRAERGSGTGPHGHGPHGDADGSGDGTGPLRDGSGDGSGPHGPGA